MCGLLLMSSSPLSQSSHTSLRHPSNRCRSATDSGAGSMQLQATKAVNKLIHKQSCKDDTIPCAAVMPWPRLGFPTESLCTDNLTSATAEQVDADPFQFPVIEWSFSDDEDSTFSDSMDSSGKTTASAPANLGCQEAPRRGSLVRSISLVSSIMKEMNSTTTTTITSLTKKNNKRTLSPFKAHKKRHSKGKPKQSNRLLALTHPVSLGGLEVGHHAESQKFFL
ncbi:expressed unknown protein [Seminavis robusta]|uniref:Uncharacterized protein n=1 Tax=Seminavis robusta TaxID=568900 RepID=A0A9N8HQU2_9STRA|nr:expressed unknown protein [Seminavis robusta]|eukprot:Sro1234_g254890.1 n/a (223) ;mRNA; f:12274-12942